jgi:hypothetical protein
MARTSNSPSATGQWPPNFLKDSKNLGVFSRLSLIARLHCGMSIHDFMMLSRWLITPTGLMFPSRGGNLTYISFVSFAAGLTPGH